MAIKVLNNHYISKKINPEIVCRLINDNIDEKNHLYNAFITRFKNSCKHASDSRKRYDTNSSLGILDGIPIVVKDNFCIASQPTTCGSAMLKQFKPPYTSTIVDKLSSAGALIIGKTNMDEFAMGSSSHNVEFGSIINPYRDGTDGSICTTGGSSGGTAVAVATGWALAGLGTDTGGSVRLPATLTGLIGLKPTYGALSRHGVIALMNALDTVGIMTRQIEDARLVFHLLKGRDLRDPTTIDYPSGDNEIDLSSVRIGIPDEFRPEGMENDIVDVWEETARYLSTIGCQVTRVSMPNVRHAGKCYSVLCCAEIASNMARYDGVRFGHRSITIDNDGATCDSTDFFDRFVSLSRSSSLGSAVRERILMGNFFLLLSKGRRQEYFEQAARVWRLLCSDFDRVFSDEVDVLLTPCAMTTAPPLVDHFTTVSGYDNRVAMVRGDLCTQPASLAGVPALTVPVCVSPGQRQLPIGVQLTAARCREDLLFQVGAAIEAWAGFGHRFGFVHERAVGDIDSGK